MDQSERAPTGPQNTTNLSPNLSLEDGLIPLDEIGVLRLWTCQARPAGLKDYLSLHPTSAGYVIVVAVYHDTERKDIMFRREVCECRFTFGFPPPFTPEWWRAWERIRAAFFDARRKLMDDEVRAIMLTHILAGENDSLGG